MRAILLVILAGLSGWFFFVGGRKLDEHHVRRAYADFWSAFHASDGKAVCDMHDKKFSGSVRMRTPAGTVEQEATKAEACEATAKFYDMKKELDRQFGQQLYINTEYTINAIEIADDKKSATTHIESELRIGTERRLFMKIKQSHKDTLIRDLGKVKFVSTDGLVSMY